MVSVNCFFIYDGKLLIFNTLFNETITRVKNILNE